MWQAGRLQPFGPRMARSRWLHKLLYAGVVILCLISCWNARLLYKSQDGTTISPKHADYMLQVMDQRDTLIDTINVLKSKCTTNGGDRNLLDRESSPCNKPQLWKMSAEVDFDEALVLGYRRKKKASLTVGIPTVRRESKMYLPDTLDSLIENSTPEELANTVILIFLADLEEEKRYIVKKFLTDKYESHLENGLMQVIQAPLNFYPPLENLKSNFGDKKERVYWRSKQVVDFAYMFLYGKQLSDYYMQLEDDVITTRGWISKVASFIEDHKADTWTTLEFSVLGFIGKLFHSYDLERLAQFLMFFYEDQPVDFLYKYFNVLNGQMELYMRAPTLFQHMGKESSLKDKKMDAVDKFFEPDERQFRDSDNPSGKVYSNMQPFEKYGPQLCYSLESGFFWTRQPQENDSVVLVFDVPTFITRIAITTGSNWHPSDSLQAGSVGLSPLLIKSGTDGSPPECSDYVDVGPFKSGQFDSDNIANLFPQKVACLRILVLKPQDMWLIVREIGIWTPHT